MQRPYTRATQFPVSLRLRGDYGGCLFIPHTSYLIPLTHTLYTGTFIELQDLFIKQVSPSRKQDPLAPLTVLVPGQLVRASLSRELTRSGCPHANACFQTVYETAQRLAEPLLREKKLQAVRDVTRDLLIQRVIEKERDKLIYFARVMDFNGFRVKLLSTLSDLSGACVTIPMLIEAANGDLRDFRPGVSLKLKEIALLWHTYNTLLDEHRLVERSTVIEKAISNLRTSVSDSHPLILYGLDELTELELRFLELLWQNRETTVYHPWKDSPAYEFTHELLNRYLSCGFENRTEIKDRAQSGSLLSMIQRGIFCELTPDEREPDYTDTSISIFSDPDAHREAQETIRSMLYPSNPESDEWTSAILMRVAQPYTNYLRSASREANVQPYFHECRTLGESLTGIALLRFVNLLKGDYKRVDVADFLLCGKLKKPESLDSCLEELPVAEWNHFALVSGVASGRDNWIANLERFKSGIQWKAEHTGDEDETNAQDLADQLSSLDVFVGWLDILFARIERIRSRKTFAEFASELREAFEQLTDCDEVTAEIFEQLDQAVQLDQTAFQVTTQGMISCIQSALRSPSKREGRYQETEPAIANIQQARGVVFDNINLIGLNEGEFPKFSTQDPILLDSERELLSQALSQGGFAFTVPQLSNRVNQEMYYFASAVDSARKHVHLSFSRMGAKGRETLPSRYMLALLSVIHGCSADGSLLNRFIERHVASRRVSRNEHAAASDAVSRREYDSSLIDESFKSGRVSDLAALQTSPLFMRILSSEHARTQEKSFTKFEGELSEGLKDADAAGWLKHIVSVLSASQLEKFWNCPFQWFASRVLELKRTEEPDILREYDPMLRGSLIHSILEKFYRTEKKAGRIESLTENDWPRLQEFAQTQFAEFESQQPVGLYMLWLREKNSILELLHRFYIDDITNWNGFMPHRFEWRFGREDDQVKLSISDKAALYFHGAIDRIDQHPDGRIRILDYKSGKNNRKLKADNLLEQRALQLHIYWIAAEILLHQKVESAAYYFMREESRRRIELTDQAAAETINKFKGVLRILDSEMRNGHCHPYPDSEICRFCDVAPACGQGRFTRKWETAELRNEYQRIREGDL